MSAGQYRKATAEDCRQVYELICDMENKQLPYARFQAIFEKQLSDPHYCCMICKEEDVVVAVLNLRFEEQLHHADRIAEIMEFVVHPKWRNRGLGSEMLEAAETAAHGCCQIEVACNQLRKNTHRFYERNGMRNFHYKFSKRLDGEDTGENRLGR